MNKRGSIVECCLAAAAALPVFMFAYLGHFSRMIADDYCVIAKSQELGPWEALHYYYTSWTSSYTRFYVVGLLAPLDKALAPITPVALVLLWCAALVWLSWLTARRLRLDSPARLLLLALAFLLVTASIYGMHSMQSFYWFISSTAYTLPIPLLAICVGIALKAACWPVRSGRFVLVAICLGMVCFINAGFSEMYLVVQGVLLSGLIAGTTLFLGSSLRRPYLMLIGASWIGTLVSAVVQLNSPGIATRSGSDYAIKLNMGVPIRTLTELVYKSAEATFQHIGHQEAFAGFILALVAALYVTLNVFPPQISIEGAERPALVAPPLWLGLLAQLLFVPVLWLHTSDSPHILDRFSLAYFTVVCINVIQILGFVFLLVLRRKIEEFLHKHGRWHTCISTVLLAALALFALTQFRSIHYIAATYLFASSFVFLCIAWFQLKATAGCAPNGRMIWLPFFASALALICYASLITLALYGQGFVVERTFAPATFVHVVSGAVWGVGLGCLIQHSTILCGNSVSAYRTASLLIVFAIGIGIMIGQLRMLPRLATFAREWDDRHAEIIRQRDSGRSNIVVPELSYDFGYDLVGWHIFDTERGGRCSAVYYSVESIIRTEDDAKAQAPQPD
ncbi:MAG: hypothetical protein OXG78_03875 [Chloroflexi bacterium]|nr:hypothetical protein [Chloroflexota bacterium]